MKRAGLHDTSGFLFVEEGEEHIGVVAEVAVVLPVHHTYTFAVPEAFEDQLQLGQRVMVPLGRKGRLTLGFVVGLDRKPWDSTLRPISSLVDAASFLSQELIDLGREIAEHYVCPLGPTLKAMTPEAVRKQRGLAKVRYARLTRPPEEIAATSKRMGAKQKALLEAMSVSEAAEVKELLRTAKVSATTLAGAVKAGWVSIEVRHELVGTPIENAALAEPSFQLNEEQSTALVKINQSIDAARFAVTLLYGVSGSGKTEVYIRAIRGVLERGGQAILLVPEIVLTTQLVSRLAARFENTAVMHSAMTEAQRSVVWRRIAAGEKQVIIGTRSAVFAPCPRLQLICVDEEQESSFKNLQAPRFHVRDVAIMRAKHLGIPVVLGSATPSLETWYRSATRADYQRVMLTKRVKDLPLPKVHLVNMEEEIDEVRQPVALSRTLERLLGETLHRGEQAVILMNRRGFAQRIYCPGCHTRITCPNCNVGLVVHSVLGLSICHYCRRKIITPTHCPNITCGAKLLQSGLGTQRVEALLCERFPAAQITRVDSDTMRHRSQYAKIVGDFEARRIDVLIGTQMIAKGLDFPFVSFVGVLGAEPVAMATDFRAHERLFQLLTQVAGRAGRAEAPGQVVVQTTSPELPALAFALRHDYVAFAEAELNDRRRVLRPPFARLARVVLTHRREETARKEAEGVVTRAQETIRAMELENADAEGPNPCALSRLRGKYRYDLLIRTGGASDLRRLMHRLDADRALRTKAESTMIDVDPVEMM